MNEFLKKLNINNDNFGACSGPNGWVESGNGKKLSSLNPSTGEIIASVYESTTEDYNLIVKKSLDLN